MDRRGPGERALGRRPRARVADDHARALAEGYDRLSPGVAKPRAGPHEEADANLIDAHEVALAHDAMGEDYDQLDDLWYPWLFSRIHEFIATQLPVDGGRQALDLGCGTGFQSFLLARAGYETRGIDLASELIAYAGEKSREHAAPPLEAPPLFRSALRSTWIPRHHARLARSLERARAGRAVTAPTFLVADLNTHDFGVESADVITCCGSVLSFIDGYPEVLARMARALRPGGLLFLEVEQKVSLDLLWPIVDRLLGGALEYEQEWDEIWTNLVTPPGRSARVDYPFKLTGGREVTMPIWIFSVAELERLFQRVGLRVEQRLGIHQATNLLPSTLLHHVPPAPLLASAFEPLRLADRVLGSRWPTWRLGCSVVYSLQKRG